ncbi:MAG TPA: hypothetical protein VER37_10980 [Thermomicrobiales bacterium]|nr:hypothetical protein [Thermomicrobiales bacterium]
MRAELATFGTPLGPYDLLTDSQARAHDAVPVTGNTGEFGQLLGRRIENRRCPI